MIHTMQVLDVTGHTEVKWNPNIKEEVDVAKATFKAMTKKGYRAFEAGDNGGQMDDFDPKIGRIILLPQLVGG